MNKFLLLLTVLLLSFATFSQNTEKIGKLIDEGVQLHDKGQYLDAIKKYDEVLFLDASNKVALSEKSLTLLTMARYDDAINTCQFCIQKYPGKESSSNIYVNYGTALDELKQPEKAVAIYNEGLKYFPNSYSLYFNKAITLFGLNKTTEAIACLQQTVKYNPNHLKSHRIMGSLLIESGQRIPSVFANCRTLVLEPEGERAAASLSNLQKVMNGNVTKGAGKKVTINVPKNMLPDSTSTQTSNENLFAATDLNLLMSTALDYDSKNKKQTDVQKFIRKFNSLCETLKETQESNRGFYWDYYVPYFIEMSNRGYIETFAHIAFASTKTKDVVAWLNSHQSQIDDFYKWSQTYHWNND